MIFTQDRDGFYYEIHTKQRRAIFYLPSEHKTYSGELSDGIKGEFGPGVRALVITLNHVANVSEPKIHEFLRNIGVHIQSHYFSNINKRHRYFLSGEI